MGIVGMRDYCTILNGIMHFVGGFSQPLEHFLCFPLRCIFCKQYLKSKVFLMLGILCAMTEETLGKKSLPLVLVFQK